MPTLTRSALLGATGAIALVGLQPLTGLIAAAAAADPGDLMILNSGLELERFAIKAYTDAAGTGLLTPAVLEVAKGFLADHSAHRDALAAAITAGGGTPSTVAAKLDVPPLANQRDILNFALDVERKAAATYLSVVPDLRDRKLAQAAAAILGVETTHVALLANALGQGRVYPSGFVA